MKIVEYTDKENILNIILMYFHEITFDWTYTKDLVILSGIQGLNRLHKILDDQDLAKYDEYSEDSWILPGANIKLLHMRQFDDIFINAERYGDTPWPMSSYTYDMYIYGDLKVRFKLIN